MEIKSLSSPLFTTVMPIGRQHFCIFADTFSRIAVFADDEWITPARRTRHDHALQTVQCAGHGLQVKALGASELDANGLDTHNRLLFWLLASRRCSPHKLNEVFMNGAADARTIFDEPYGWLLNFVKLDDIADTIRPP